MQVSGCVDDPISPQSSAGRAVDSDRDAETHRRARSRRPLVSLPGPPFLASNPKKLFGRLRPANANSEARTFVRPPVSMCRRLKRRRVRSCPLCTCRHGSKILTRKGRSSRRFSKFSRHCTKSSTIMHRVDPFTFAPLRRIVGGRRSRLRIRRVAVSRTRPCH